jgi:4-amino-4-deoxy-L-arabinose transferase-like glycosyltransferase
MKSHIFSPFMNKNSQENIQYAVLIFACIALCFTGIVHRDLWTPDEPRVAAVSLEMSRNGNFIIPYLAGEPFIEKPPLHFALAAGLTRIFGATIGNTGAIRLLSALMAIGTLAVTFLLAKRLGGITLALPSAVILATMPGFIDNFHRIRVDPSLAFFVAAAIWCFAEVYVADRRWYCLPAGLFTAGAFLVKGFIGPVLIGMGWLGLAIPWGIKRIRGQGKPQFYVCVHGVGVLLFVILIGSWMALFRLKGGADLWNIWLWKNQVGRLLGTSQEFSHLQPGKWYYYLIALAMYGIPWLSAIFLWVWSFFKDLFKKHPISATRVFLLVWGFGTLVLLTLSVTKRAVYLTPALPAFAIMGADVFKKLLPKWCRVFFICWIALSVLILVVLTGFPLVSGLLAMKMPSQAGAFMAAFSCKNLVAGIGLALYLFLAFRPGRMSFFFHVAAATAIVWISIFMGPVKAVDLEKSMQKTVTEFYAQIPADQRPRVAGLDFSETMRAYFYYYCDWSVPQIRDPDRLRKIIAGIDPEYDSIIVPDRRLAQLEQLKPFYHTICESHPNKTNRKRKTYWVKGS